MIFLQKIASRSIGINKFFHTTSVLNRGIAFFFILKQILEYWYNIMNTELWNTK